jgi:hypothetical protein
MCKLIPSIPPFDLSELAQFLEQWIKMGLSYMLLSRAAFFMYAGYIKLTRILG